MPETYREFVGKPANGFGVCAGNMRIRLRSRWSSLSRFSACLKVLVALFLIAQLSPWLAAPAFGQLLGSLNPNGKDQRADALRSIPMDRLKDETRARLMSVIQNPTIHRRLPVKTIDCDPDMYVFLVRNPEVVVNMWQLMGITTVNCKRIGPYVHEGTDGAGTTARMDLIYGSRDVHVFYADGYHAGTVFKRQLKGKCVLVLKTDYEGVAGPDMKVKSRLDFFLQLENIGADLLARTIQPIVGTVADSNFNESLNFVGQMSRAAALKGDGVHVLADKLNNVEPKVRDEFINVSKVTYLRGLNQGHDVDAGETRALPTGFPRVSDADEDEDSQPFTAPMQPQGGSRARR